ncbi:cytochrome c3 family protein [Geoalkalibacter sp.]|uniref:cytochrome c3 family protein n=1 Tax=Geoalkalibacter sp. TaxID=3041440 RepID=UPI00272E65B2|nr:cytochrome c3 family protein [Geoalkalibacter sp.]
MRRMGLAGLLILGLLAAPLAVWADEGSCIQCHAPQPGALGEPVALWRGSVHQGNGISCHGCHGGDPTLMSMEAMSPERGFLGAPEDSAVPSFCGRCHVGVEEDYRASAHGLALGEGGPQCVTCHGSHAVRVAGLDLINPQDCSRCHDYGRAGELRTAMEQTETLILALDAELKQLRRIGIAVEDWQGRLFALRNDFHRLFHSVDVDKVRRQTDTFQAKLAGMQDEVAELRAELNQRKWIGAGVVILLLAASGLFALLRQSYGRQENTE